MSLIVKRRGLKASKGGGKIELTSAMFLGKVGEKAYITVDQLMDFVDNGRIEDVDEMDNFFQLTKQRLRMVYSRNVRTDAGGVDYLYLNFYRRNAVEGVKVVLIDNMKQFIEDYSNGKFTFSFTLEDLIAEAEKS